MSGTRALFASIGASVALVAAAALSLLGVSAVFAFGGWSPPVAESARQSALVLTADAAPKHTAAAKPVKLPAPARASRESRAVAQASRPARTSVRADAAPAQSRSARTHSSVAAVTSPELSPPSAAVRPPAPSAPPAKKAAGDGVRSAGDDVAATVQSAGTALAGTTSVLLPPVTESVQTVVNVLAALLNRTTNGVGTVVDGALPVK